MNVLFRRGIRNHHMLTLRTIDALRNHTPVILHPAHLADFFLELAPKIEDFGPINITIRRGTAYLVSGTQSPIPQPPEVLILAAELEELKKELTSTRMRHTKALTWARKLEDRLARKKMRGAAPTTMEDPI